MLLHLRMMAYATAIITVSVNQFPVMMIINGIDADLVRCHLPPSHVTTQTVQKCDLRLRKDLSFVSTGNNALVYSFPMSI